MSHSLEGKSVLFLDKVFLRGKKRKAVTGAERFNLHLIKELADLNCDVSVYATRCWKQDINSVCSSSKVKHFKLPRIALVAWPKAILTLIILLTIDRRNYDAVIMGNVGRIMIPLIKLLFLGRLKSRLLLMAHREPTERYIQFAKGLNVCVVAVNEKIATSFRNAGFKNVEVYFGEIRTSHFLSNLESPTRGKQINFCVFGNLDPAWKGSDTAVAAFRALPSTVRENSCLHLAGFSNCLPNYAEENIITYPWMSEEEVPEFLGKMDIALVPSRDTTIMKETFSQATVQAMLAGLPLLVNNIPILCEKVVKGGGLVFHDVSELTALMEKLALNESLRAKLGQEARENACKQFSWSTGHFVEKFLFPQDLPKNNQGNLGAIKTPVENLVR